MRWYSSDLLAIPHAMLCGCGGVSINSFASLNLSFGVGDNSENVEVNRQRLKQCQGIHYLVSAVQVHGDQVVIAENIKQDTEFEKADSLITSEPGNGLLIQQADCQAILLHDPVQGVIGAVHNGWRGSTLNIIAKTVAAMHDYYGVNPDTLKAVISPSLGPCCAEFINFQQELPKSFHTRQITPFHFDFWAISRDQLTKAGLKDTNIETAGICTVCNKDFFSYRREVRQGSGVTGRNGSVIALS
ncbi:MAG: peptidoglycan editing factor PgeF [Deltaproteobacteria bacterium]|nr:peptidoglycan editing factor PgeF [Deltaproteobacteria bacterium]